MYLTDFQNVLCQKIRDGQIDSVLSFLEFEKILVRSEEEDFNTVYRFIDSKAVRYRVNTSLKIQENLEAFLVLWRNLEKEDLILSYSNYGKYDFTVLYGRDYSGNSSFFFNTITKSTYQGNDEDSEKRNKASEFCTLFYNLFACTNYASLRIIPYISLSTFIENGYKTDKELEIEAQQEAYKKQEVISNKSLFRSTFAIWASIGLAILTSAFNYYTYTNQRKVEIINLDSAMEKYSRAAVVRARYEDSLSKAHGARRDTSIARAGKKMSK